MPELAEVDFEAEAKALFENNSFDFGKFAVPIEIVKEAVLKSVCGWHNGSTSESIIVALGLVKVQRAAKDKLTRKGKAFMWWAVAKRGCRGCHSTHQSVPRVGRREIIERPVQQRIGPSITDGKQEREPRTTPIQIETTK